MAISKELKAALLSGVANPFVRSDVPHPERAVGKLIIDGVELRYGQMIVVVEAAKIEEAKQLVAHLGDDERRRMRHSVGKTLGHAYPKIIAGAFDKTQADNFYSDLLLWHALTGMGLKY